jgi:phosphodiesterase/alkaline phosphatase D-like protein
MQDPEHVGGQRRSAAWLPTFEAHGHKAGREHQPVRVPRVQSWADLSITRTIDWGALARFWVMDTRQFRDDQACNDGTQAICEAARDPKRGMLGAAQEQWMVNGLGASQAKWQVLAQQVMMAPYDAAPGDDVRVSMDQWSGYPVARDRLLNEVARRAANRTVVITGDIHTNWVNDLRTDDRDFNKPIVATELVGTSISSASASVRDSVVFVPRHIKFIGQTDQAVVACTRATGVMLLFCPLSCRDGFFRAHLPLTIKLKGLLKPKRPLNIASLNQAIGTSSPQPILPWSIPEATGLNVHSMLDLKK